MPEQAQSPIVWHAFQALMSELGYEMISHTDDHTGVIFRLKGGVITEGRKNPVTIAYPDYVARDGVTPAFEKSYVIDLLTQIAGANGGKATLTFLANRKMDG